MYIHFTDKPIVTNPITWKVNSDVYASNELHKGYYITRVSDKIMRPKCVSAMADSKSGILRIDDTHLKFKLVKLLKIYGDYHLLDYGLFWADIRYNAIERIEKWLSL